MRIVGGKFAGRDLVSPNDFRVRPTAEHVRAELLELLRGDVPGARVLDLFAGTGARPARTAVAGGTLDPFACCAVSARAGSAEQSVTAMTIDRIESPVGWSGLPALDSARPAWVGIVLNFQHRRTRVKQGI